MPFHQNPESASASATRPISFTKKSFDGKYQFISCHSVGGENLSLTLPLIYYFKSCCNQVNMKQRGRVVTLLCVIFRIMQKLYLILQFIDISPCALLARVILPAISASNQRPGHYLRQTCGKKLPTKIKTRRWQGNDNCGAADQLITWWCLWCLVLPASSL